MRTGVILLLIGILWGFPGIANAKPLVADLSQYRIEIDSSFNGTRLLLFGARNETGDIVVVVRGPEQTFIVRRKERVAGMWINRRERRFSHVPTYYTLATSKPFAQLHNAVFDTLRIGLKRAIMENGAGDPVFADALLAHEQASQLYSDAPQNISFMGESLFKLMVPFPDSIPGGNYSADVYLFDDGQLKAMQSIPIHVQKVGFDAWVADIAQNHSVFYGMLAVLIAVSMGWGASSLMRRI